MYFWILSLCICLKNHACKYIEFHIIRDLSKCSLWRFFMCCTELCMYCTTHHAIDWWRLLKNTPYDVLSCPESTLHVLYNSAHTMPPNSKLSTQHTPCQQTQNCSKNRQSHWSGSTKCVRVLVYKTPSTHFTNTNAIGKYNLIHSHKDLHLKFGPEIVD
jgi:hypothetical protein